QINARHLEAVARTQALDDDAIAAISLIDEREGRRVKMGQLAFLGCGRVNGVSAMHSRLMGETVFRDLHALYPDRIVNVTNRITEYKRRLLNLSETVAQYNAMPAEPTRNWAPRVKVFAGKAAASYAAAKLIIKLAHDIAQVINHDPAVRDLLKVVFLANYNV